MRECAELAAFVRGERSLADFCHREHVRMAFEMLRRHDFAASVHHYSQALRRMTARAGKPEAFHQTVTVAFLALVSERLPQCPASDFAVWVERFPELLDKTLLSAWYSHERLASAAARSQFLLPDRLPVKPRQFSP